MVRGSTIRTQRYWAMGLGLGIGLLPWSTIGLAVPSVRPGLQPANPSSYVLEEADRLRFRSIRDHLRLETEPQDWPSQLQAVAGQFLRSAYVAGLLDLTPQERPVVNLRQFDCLTIYAVWY